MKAAKCIATLLILLISPLVWAVSPIDFADAKLKGLIEAQLGVYDPTPEDMLGLTTLYAQRSGTTDLTGLEYAVNLRELHLWGNRISDISALSGLTNLRSLYLWANQISDVTALAELTNLQVLALAENHITEISALSGLESLSELYLYVNQIADITPLSKLENLQTLYLYTNNITDVSPLAGLTGLSTLELGDNEISGISALSGLTQLTSLLLWGNQISDISELAGLPHLQELYLQTNQIRDVSALTGLTNLRVLHLWENQISDISSLSGLNLLTELALPNNLIQDISPLAGLTNLTTLYLYINEVSDVSALSGLVNLTTLDLAGNRISDVRALAGLTNLTTLELGDNQLRDTTSLLGLVELEELHLYDNQISDILALAGLPGLTYLDLEDNQIQDVSPLSALTNLVELDLSGNQISDVRPLAGLKNWEVISLYRNPLNVNAYCTDLYSISGHADFPDYDPNPAPPKNVTVSQVWPGQQARVSWDGVCNGPRYTTYYQVYRSHSLTGGKTVISAWQTNTEFVDVTAEADTFYVYWVRAATNNQGSSGLSDYSIPGLGLAGHIDLRDAGESYSAFAPRVLRPGQDLEIAARIENVGTEHSGPFAVNAYLSLDTQIDPSDHHLGQTNVETIGPGATFDLSGIGRIAADIPAGYYYVGWIIDQDNLVPESDEGNNRAYKEGYQVQVTIPLPPATTAWAQAPYAIGPTSISMTAAAAFDSAEVEYLFDCLTDGGHDSSWQMNPTYVDSNLQPDLAYTYRVKARNLSQAYETGWSEPKTAVTGAALDTTPPAPDPMTWATLPYATGLSSIAMVASAATDASGDVQYYFDCQTPGGHDSGWQTDNAYEDIGLAPNTSYQYRVTARDSFGNQTEFSTSASAQTDMIPSTLDDDFRGLGDPLNSPWCVATALSADGLVVIGHDEVQGIPVYWHKGTGMIPLPLNVGDHLSATRVQALSRHGSIIVGTCPSQVFDPATDREQDAFVWSEASGLLSLANPTDTDSLFASAQGISADGSLITGVLSDNDGRTRAFAWTDAEGMTKLGLLPGGQAHSGGTAVSADAQVIAGWSHSGNTGAFGEFDDESVSEAFRWTWEEGMVGLGFLPGGGHSEALAASWDGTVIAGTGSTGTSAGPVANHDAFVWDQLRGMQPVGCLPGYTMSRVNAVSADGSIAVGQCSTPDYDFEINHRSGQAEAFIWDSKLGIQNLKTLLVEKYDMNVADWVLFEAIGISADGSVIVGNGINPEGRVEPWMAIIPALTHALDLDLVNPKLPPAVVSGDGTKIKLPVTVTNVSDVTIEKGTTLDLIVKARSIHGGADRRIAVAADQSIGNLKPGKVKKINADLSLPPGMPTSAYVFVVQVGTLETSTPLDQPVLVAYGGVALTSAFAKNSLPLSVVTGTPLKGAVSVAIGNQGNVAVPKDKTVNLKVLLQSQLAGMSYELAVAENYKIAGLKPGKTKTVNISINEPGALPEGLYSLVAVVDSEDPALTVPAIAGDTITISPPFVDLQAEVINPKLPAQVVAGSGKKITLPVTITNHGNVSVGKDQRIDVSVRLRTLSTGALHQIDTLFGQSIGNLAPGRSKKINVSVTIPASVIEGVHVFDVLIDASNHVIESNENNNTAMVDGPIYVESAPLDLTF